MRLYSALYFASSPLTDLSKNPDLLEHNFNTPLFRLYGLCIPILRAVVVALCGGDASASDKDSPSETGQTGDDVALTGHCGWFVINYTTKSIGQ